MQPFKMYTQFAFGQVACLIDLCNSLYRLLDIETLVQAVIKILVETRLLNQNLEYKCLATISSSGRGPRSGSNA